MRHHTRGVWILAIASTAILLTPWVVQVVAQAPVFGTSDQDRWRAHVDEVLSARGERLTSLEGRLNSIEAYSSQLLNAKLRERTVMLEDRMQLILWLLGTLSLGILGVIGLLVKQTLLGQRQWDQGMHQEEQIKVVHDLVNTRENALIEAIKKEMLQESVVEAIKARLEGHAAGLEEGILRKESKQKNVDLGTDE